MPGMNSPTTTSGLIAPGDLDGVGAVGRHSTLKPRGSRSPSSSGRRRISTTRTPRRSWLVLRAALARPGDRRGDSSGATGFCRNAAKPAASVRPRGRPGQRAQRGHGHLRVATWRARNGQEAEPSVPGMAVEPPDPAPGWRSAPWPLRRSGDVDGRAVLLEHPRARRWRVDFVVDDRMLSRQARWRLVPPTRAAASPPVSVRMAGSAARRDDGAAIPTFAFRRRQWPLLQPDELLHDGQADPSRRIPAGGVPSWRIDRNVGQNSGAMPTPVVADGDGARPLPRRRPPRCRRRWA